MCRPPSSVLVDGGNWDSAAGGASGGGRRLRVRLPPRGVRESAARGMVMAAQIGIGRGGQWGGGGEVTDENIP